LFRKISKENINKSEIKKDKMGRWRAPGPLTLAVGLLVFTTLLSLTTADIEPLTELEYATCFIFLNLLFII
jgi:hypothetical protein